jgi:hypothetical protein
MPPQPVRGVVADAVRGPMPMPGAIPEGIPGAIPGPGGIPGAGAAPEPLPGSAVPGGGDDAPTELLAAVPAGPVAAYPGPGDPGGVPLEDDTPAYGMPVPPPPPEHGFAAGPGGDSPRRGPGARRLLPVLVGAVALVALGTVAAALGVFPGSGETDTALPGPKPAPSTASAPTAAPPAAPTAASSGSPSASPSKSASPSASPSPSKSASPSASPSASRSPAPPSSPTPTPSRSAGSAPPAPAQGRTLRYGDSGAEVTKLQQLLAAQGLYEGKVHGKFDRWTENAVSEFQYYNDIYDDGWGVYGPATRQALESAR